MKGTTSLARLGLMAWLTGMLTACGAVQPPTAMHVLQAADQGIAADSAVAELDVSDSEVSKTAPAAHQGLTRKLSDDEAKLYAKGFNAGFTDSVRAQRFKRHHRRDLLLKRQYDDRHSSGYETKTPVSGTCKTLPTGEALCTPGQSSATPEQTAPKAETTLIAADETP